MHRPVVLLICLAAAWLGAAPPAAARTVQDCEAIRDWHAYNTCLASFGPRRGQRVAPGSQPRAQDAERTVYGRSRTGARTVVRAGPRGMAVQRTANGRVRATFDVGGPRQAGAR